MTIAYNPAAKFDVALNVEHVRQTPAHASRFNLLQHIVFLVGLDDAWCQHDQQLATLFGFGVVAEGRTDQR